MKRLGILCLAAGLLWLVTSAWTETSAANKNQTQNKTSVKAATGKAQKRTSVKAPTRKTQRPTGARVDRRTQNKTSQSRPSKTSRKGNDVKKSTNSTSVKPDSLKPNPYEGTTHRDNQGHAPDGTYVDRDGKLRYYSTVKPYQEPNTGRASRGSGSSSSDARGWQPPPTTIETGQRSGEVFSDTTGSRRSTSGELQNLNTQKKSAGGSKGSSPYPKPDGRTSTSNEVRR